MGASSIKMVMMTMVIIIIIGWVFSQFNYYKFFHCWFQSEEPHDTMPISSFLQKERPRTAAFPPAYTPPRYRQYINTHCLVEPIKCFLIWLVYYAWSEKTLCPMFTCTLYEMTEMELLIREFCPTAQLLSSHFFINEIWLFHTKVFICTSIIYVHCM